MRKSLCIPALLAIFAFAVPAKSQEETSKADLYVGYDYLRVNSGGTAFNFNGGSGQLAYNVNHWLDVVGEFGGYHTGTGFRAGILSYPFGPRISFRPHGKLTPFAHVLFGGGRTIVDSPQNAFAMSAGGGVDLKSPNTSRFARFRPNTSGQISRTAAATTKTTSATAPASFSASAPDKSFSAAGSFAESVRFVLLRYFIRYTSSGPGFGSGLSFLSLMSGASQSRSIAATHSSFWSP
jgi:hypothetical protein